MDAEFQKEQNGTLFVWVVAHWKGVWGVGGPSGWSTLEIGHAFQK